MKSCKLCNNDEYKDTVMIPVKRELADGILKCCIESRCNPVVVSNTILENGLDRYIGNRNKEIATWTEEKVAQEYPNVAPDSIPKLIQLAKEDKLGVPDPEWFYVPDEDNDYQDYSDTEFHPEVAVAESDAECLDPSNPPKFNKVHVADIVEGVELLEALNNICKTAHQVMINVHIITEK